MNTIEEALLKNRKVTEEINSIHEYLIYESLSNKFITEEDDNESYSVFGSIDEAKKYAKENNLKDFDIIEYNEEFEESAYKVVFTEGFDFENDFLKIDESIIEESTEKVVSKNWHDLLSELDRREVEYKNDLEPDQVFGKVCLETIEINNKPVFGLFQDEDQFAIYCMKEKKEIKPFNAKEVVDRLVGEEVKEGLNEGHQVQNYKGFELDWNDDYLDVENGKVDFSIDIKKNGKTIATVQGGYKAAKDYIDKNNLYEDKWVIYIPEYSLGDGAYYNELYIDLVLHNIDIDNDQYWATDVFTSDINKAAKFDSKEMAEKYAYDLDAFYQIWDEEKPEECLEIRKESDFNESLTEAINLNVDELTDEEAKYLNTYTTEDLCRELANLINANSKTYGAKMSTRGDEMYVYDLNTNVVKENFYYNLRNKKEDLALKLKLIKYITEKKYINESLDEEVELEETYSDEELDKMIGKVYNQQKVQKIFRREKYGDSRLFAKTICTKCGRDKEVFLSNLINDPDKYGSCICSDENIDSTIEYAQDLYKGSKVLSSNTSGYTGVSFVKNYGGKPYNKWRAYIEIDGKRYYLGDFENKKDAVKARKVAGEKGVKWYKDNRNKLMRDVRKKTKKYSKSKYKDSKTKRSALTSKDLKDLKG